MLRRRTSAPAGRPPAIYPPREDTLLLARFARARAPERVLEIGCGAGRAALAAARGGARVVATDLNPFALRRLRERALAQRLPIEVVRTNLAEGLGRFDRILANPPYLPTRAAERDPDRWENLALDGGATGSRVSQRILRSVPAHLRPDGAAYLLVSSVQTVRSRAGLARAWRELGGIRRVVGARRLEGETLWVWKLTLPMRKVRRPARRGGGPPRRSGARRRTPRRSLHGSSPAPGRGRTRAPGAASGRRRSPRGS